MTLDLRPDRATRAARLITELFAPIVLIFALLLVVAVHSADSVRKGLLVGLVAAFFAGGLPYAILLLGIRRGRLGDRHLRLREERPAMMVIGLVSVAAGAVAMHRLDAPREVLALVLAMVAGVVVALAISLFWKISIHSACAAGTVAILVIVFGPSMLLASPLVLAVTWARVHLRDHSVAQVMVGAVVGAVVAAGVMAPLA